MKLPSETISGAFELYQTTPEFQKKITSQKTRQQYVYQQNRVCELKIDDGYVGDVPLAKLTVAKCQEIYWKILESVQSGDGIRFAN